MNLKCIRKKRGLTQKELSTLSGVPLPSVRRYEQEPETLLMARVGTIAEIAKILNVNIEELIYKEE